MTETPMIATSDISQDVNTTQPLVMDVPDEVDTKDNMRVNILDDLYPENGHSEEMNGVYYQWNNGECLASGTSTDYSQSRIFFDKYAMPFGLVAGKTYTLECKTTDSNLRFSIVFYSGGEISKQWYFDSDKGFTVPSNAEGCLIRAFVDKNVQVNGTISMRLYQEESSPFKVAASTINNSYITEHYENTYNITAEPVLTTDNNYYLYAPGDTRDMTGSIQTMLDSDGVCRLGPGDFYVTGIEIPDYGMLIGSGNKTRIILDASVKKGYAVKLKNYCCVKDLQIIGNEKSLETSVIENMSSVGAKHGILFEGTADSTEQAVTYYRSTIENCTISDFDGGGITC